MRSVLTMLLMLLVSVAAGMSGEADVVDVKIAKEGNGSYRFDVTVRHADEGWKHYADRWDVLAPDGTVLGSRVLAHPHVNEQPFTRSLQGVKIPDAVENVTIRARDTQHGFGGVAKIVEVPR